MLATLLVLAAPACGRDTTTTTTTTSTVAATTTGVSVTSTTRPAATTTTVAKAPVVLRSDGLGVVAVGATKDATVAALTAALGPSTATGKGCELAGPDVTTVSWKELSVQFVQGKFDSYTLRPPPGTQPVLNLKTPEGATLGTTVASLKNLYGTRLTIPGLPPEFGGNDFAITFAATPARLFGSLTATTDQGTVQSLFTQVCE